MCLCSGVIVYMKFMLVRNNKSMAVPADWGFAVICEFQSMVESLRVGCAADRILSLPGVRIEHQKYRLAGVEKNLIAFRTQAAKTVFITERNDVAGCFRSIEVVGPDDSVVSRGIHDIQQVPVRIIQYITAYIDRFVDLQKIFRGNDSVRRAQLIMGQDRIPRAVH